MNFVVLTRRRMPTRNTAEATWKAEFMMTAVIKESRRCIAGNKGIMPPLGKKEREIARVNWYPME